MNDLDFSFILGNSDSNAEYVPKCTETPFTGTQEGKPSNYTAEPQNAVENTPEAVLREFEVTTALRAVKMNREAAEGIMRQLELDILKHRDLCVLLLYAAEALDRMSGHGDGYFVRIKQALQENGYM